MVVIIVKVGRAFCHKTIEGMQYVTFCVFLPCERNQTEVERRNGLHSYKYMH